MESGVRSPGRGRSRHEYGRSRGLIARNQFSGFIAPPAGAAFRFIARGPHGPSGEFILNAKQFIEAHCLNALPKSARQYRYMVYDKPGFGEGAFGRLSGLREREGKVIAIDPEWVGVKERTNTFVVLSIAMISPLDMGHLKRGDRVTIHFPQVRRFDGKRANGEDDPAIGNSRIITLTGATTRLPVHWPADPGGRTA